MLRLPRACSSTRSIQLSNLNPFDLDIDVTSSTTLSTLNDGHDYLRALVMAFRLNEAPLICHVYNTIPASSIALVVKGLPTVYLPRILRFVAQATDESPRLEYNLRWIEALLTAHGAALKEQSGRLAPELRAVQKCVARVQAELTRLSQDNIYTLDYLLSQPHRRTTNGAMNDLKALEAQVVNGHGEDDEEDGGGEGEGEWIGLGSDDDDDDMEG